MGSRRPLITNPHKPDNYVPSLEIPQHNSTFAELNRLPSAANLKANSNVNRQVNFAKHIAEKILEASRNGEYKLVVDTCISGEIKKTLREKGYSLTINEEANETVISWDVPIG